MPNIKSARTRMWQNEKRYMRNKSIRTSIKNLKKKVMLLINEKTEEISLAQQVLNNFKKKVDQAWAKGVLTRNTSSRIKSSMERAYNKVYTS